MNPPVLPHDEQRLIAESRRGDLRAFSSLVRQHHGRVRAYVGGYLFRSDATDDVAQDVFLNAFRHLDGYRGDAPFSTWLLRIARNQLMTYLRAEGRRRTRETRSLADAFAPWVLSGLDDDDTQLTRQELEIAALRDCIEKLAPASAAMVRDHYFNARSIVEIAQALGKKEGTVRMTLLRIRQALRACIRQASGGTA
jgi:RNA polymerase sigma-70 factor (ECF subfamily)